MPCILIRHTVEDYETWKPHFEAHEETRDAYGERGYFLYRESDDPNEVVAILEFESREQAESFLQESDVEEVMAEAGVVGEPEVVFLDEIEAKRPAVTSS